MMMNNGNGDHANQTVDLLINGTPMNNGIDVKPASDSLNGGSGLDSVTDSSTFDVTSTDSDHSTLDLDVSNTVTSVTSDSDSQTRDQSASVPVKNTSNGCHVNLENEDNLSELSASNTDQTKSDNDSSACSSLPNLNSTSWYLNPCFERYWKQYYQSMAWCEKHKQAVNALSESRYQQHSLYGRHSSNRHNPYTVNVFPSPGLRGGLRGRGCKRGRGRGVSKGRGKNVVKPRIVTESSTCEGSLDVSDTDSEVYEMEITNEMLEFFAKSEQHRKERDAKKSNSEDEADHVDLEGVKTNKKAPTSKAPKEQPGVRRTSEMNQLYGKGAAMIHGMETALQMTFDRNMDILQPKYWPNMPLKIVFK